MKSNLNLFFVLGVGCIVIPHGLVLLTYLATPALQDRVMPDLVPLAFGGTIAGVIVLMTVAVSGWLSRGR